MKFRGAECVPDLCIVTEKALGVKGLRCISLSEHEKNFLCAVDGSLSAFLARVAASIGLATIVLGGAGDTEAGIVQRGVLTLDRFCDYVDRQVWMDFGHLRPL